MRWARIGLLIAGLAVVASCGDDRHECVEPQPSESPPIADILADLEGLGFDEFLEDSYAQLLSRSPELVTELGLSDELGLANDRLDDISEEYVEDTYDLSEGVLELLRTYDRGALTATQRVSYDVYEWHLDDRSRHRELRYYEYPVSQSLAAVHNQLLLFLDDIHPVDSRANAEAYVERLRQVSVKISQVIDGLRVREEMGLVPPRLVLDWALPQIAQISDASSARGVFLYDSFAARLADVAELDDVDRQELLDDAEAAFECHVIPAFQALEAAVAELAERGSSQAGVGQFPGGDDYYAYALRHYTTTDLTADDVHQLGLEEIERIHAEMRQRFDALGYPAAESIPQLYARVAEDGGVVQPAQIVSEYEEIIAAAEESLSEAFHEGAPIPVVVIGGEAGGFYVAGTPDGARPGAFYASVVGPEPRYGMRTLAYHEAVPGHHLQISLSQVLDLPMLRRVLHFTGYVEGWALYAERLAADLGWYDGDIYGDLGRLQAEAFRAARLVVDTGIHARGWSFDEAADFMVDTVGYPLWNAQGQVLRYMAWPGQATAYKIGMLRMLALRDEAQSTLGAAFDLRDFHAAVLDEGALPLDVLDEVVAAYLEASAR